jgi:hypothetical protein
MVVVDAAAAARAPEWLVPVVGRVAELAVAADWAWVGQELAATAVEGQVPAASAAAAVEEAKERLVVAVVARERVAVAAVEMARAMAAAA